MTPPSDSAEIARGGRSHLPLPLGTLAGFAIAIVSVALIALFTYRTLGSREEAAARVTHTLSVIRQLESVLSTLKDAETGQRGFLLTGEESYLEPYVKAQGNIHGELQAVRALTIDNPDQQQSLDALERAATDKMAELDSTIVLRRDGKASAALDIVRTDRGRATMDSVRAIVAEMEGREQALFATRQAEWQDSVTLSSRVTWGGSALLILLIGAAALLMSGDYRARERETWLRSGQAGMSARMVGEQRLDQLGERILAFLATYLDAQVGALYIVELDGRFRRFAGYALPPGEDADVLRPGEGLLGQVAKMNEPLRVKDVPAGYFPVASSLGRATPRELLIAPASIDGVVQAVVELGLFRPIEDVDAQLLARVSESFAVAVQSSKDRTRLEELLDETQRQAEELQAQQEELRVSNEELEEQGSALRESQVRLEAQQAELEQINSHLEEQTQLLEVQKDDLAKAQAVLVDKASELERSNRYKSEFLANMSHELRTPLNSTLILAKLLADNKDQNLTPEQVKFAQTISSAGNDLLALINDILDLSKIEAGRVEVVAESIPVAGAVESVIKSLQPVAQQKGLQLAGRVSPGTPDRIETDPQRLGQILKNLLSNALKFTQKGEVTLRVSARADGIVAFDVRDTGIGIPTDQQQFIFDAFRQADGSTHRKYGGTGLGLSISRDLAWLLGGDIMVQSAPGQGSVFTLTLPRVYAEDAAMKRRQPDAWGASAGPARNGGNRAETPPPASPPPIATGLDDDRAHLTSDVRRILVIEDDVRFAVILRDLAHELGFQCIVTHSANDGLAAASAYRPSAIVLDINLPDHSGLGVLDQLKRNPLTRHIPVHVASVADYAHQARERGAVGYALKPVKREQLIHAFRQLEAKFSQSLHRILVVEDDERQRESIRQLLANGDVQITGVETAAAALAQLQVTTFDCVVMDLNLPDLSGYELLEQMAEKDDVSFPPVIVYTGRSLTGDEEQRLRRYSKSIIIKDARSPERLLDEVTLFLHQVESTLPVERQRMLKVARDRDATLEGRRILVVEDDARNIFALSSVLEPKGATVDIARNGREALEALERVTPKGGKAIDLVLMDIMMPEMDGLTAMREIRKRPEWKKLPIIALTAKAMKDDQDRCLAAGANDYIAKPLDVEKLLSLVRVWMPR